MTSVTNLFFPVTLKRWVLCDVLLGLSTSGNSMNIIRAPKRQKKKEMKVIILSGKGWWQTRPLADVELRVHTRYADRIQEVHIKIIHILMLLIAKQVVDSQFFFVFLSRILFKFLNDLNKVPGHKPGSPTMPALNPRSFAWCS